MAQFLKHYMQGVAWAAFKSRRGWSVHQFDLTPFGIKDSLKLYSRRVPLIGEIFYIPKAPNILNPEILSALKTSFPSAVVFELEIEDGEFDAATIAQLGLQVAQRTVQYRSTLKIDLTQEPDQIKRDMSSTTRNEINKGKKLGMTVREAELNQANMQQMYDLMQTVHARVGHFVRPPEYLFDQWQEFAKAGAARLFFAEYENQVKSGALIFTEGKRAWYKEGGSVRDAANLPAPSFLQWEVIRSLKRDGFVEYDLGGVAPRTVDEPNNPMQNVYHFKKRLSSNLHVSPPMLDLVAKPGPYALWRRLEPQYFRLYNLVKKDFWY